MTKSGGMKQETDSKFYSAVSGAAAGPVMIMVDQMQYMSVIGRVGGGTSAATRAFSEEFAIFNFDILPNVFDKKPAKNPLARRHRQVLRRGELENSTSDSRRQDEDGGEVLISAGFQSMHVFLSSSPLMTLV